MKSGRILIVEDDPVTAIAHRKRLAREGYQVEIASDGAKGLERLSEFQPDAILLDLQIPVFSGLELLKKIRASENFQHLPIIVFTSATTPQLIDDCISAGATRVFEKWALSSGLLLEELKAI